jgi:hypothetical protein
VLAAQNVIECSNCGAGAALWVAVAAVGVASCALWISAREHREFMRHVRARARFDFSFKVGNYESSTRERVIEASSSSIRPVVRLRIGNYGDAAASSVLLNVLLPISVEGLRWCGPNGEELASSKAGPPVAADYQLHDHVGAPVRAQHLVAEWFRVPRKGGAVFFFCFTLPLPRSGAEVRVPINAVAQADEIPDEVDEYEGSFEVRARRVSETGGSTG